MSLLTRRHVLLAAAAAPGLGLGLAGCVEGSGSPSYDEAATRSRETLNGSVGSPASMLELVRYATLAPSSHNTQCWKFSVERQGISIHPDLSRRCPAVDPDDHHLFVSLGCAAENVAQAALASGLHGEVVFQSTPIERIDIALEPARAVVSPLFEAIPKRQCTRAAFDGKALGIAELRLLERAGSGHGVKVLLLTDKLATEKVLECVVAGNSLQMNDPAFFRELKQWIRFSDAEAMRSADGLSTRASGNPSLPRWLANPLFGLVVTARSENDKYARQIRSSAGIAVFVSEANDKAHWVEAGRCCERFALQATALGIRSAFLNQPVEVASIRPQFASFLGVPSLRPDLVMRFGRGPEMPRSLRRDVASVLERSG